MPDIRKFFDDYAAAAVKGDVTEIADFYSADFLVIAAGESRIFRNDDKFLEWLQSVHEFNRQTGLKRLFLQDVSGQSFGPHAIYAFVTWAALYEKTGDRTIGFAIRYLLQQQGAKLKIVLYTSDEDQEAVMKKHGLL